MNDSQNNVQNNWENNDQNNGQNKNQNKPNHSAPNQYSHTISNHGGIGQDNSDIISSEHLLTYEEKARGWAVQQQLQRVNLGIAQRQLQNIQELQQQINSSSKISSKRQFEDDSEEYFNSGAPPENLHQNNQSYNLYDSANPAVKVSRTFGSSPILQEGHQNNYPSPNINDGQMQQVQGNSNANDGSNPSQSQWLYDF